VRWRLACFDLDGTLVQATSVSQHLADRFGQSPQMAELERRYAASEISNSVVADEQAAMYGGMPLARVIEALDDIPCIEGIDATVNTLREQGVNSLLCTVTWSFAAEEFCRRHGFVKGFGTEIDIEPGGMLTGRVQRHFDEWDKLAFVRAHCAEVGVELEDCIAIGDSRSDVPLFEVVGFSIAINATEQAREAASVALDTEDLTDVLALIP
jgi:phosphoserine phosphatase